MVKELQTIDVESVKLYMNIGSIVGIIGLAVWFASWKTQVDIITREDKVSTKDFAILQTDVSYIKDSVKLLLEKKG